MGKAKDWMKLPRTGKAPGVGPSTPMEILDNPPRALEWLRETLGIERSGNPGDIYHPPTANRDGTVNPAYHSPKPNPLKFPGDNW